MSKRNDNSDHTTSLGSALKHARETRSESLMEVSGAVEVDVDVLERIESNEHRPSEELLLLLINHFSMPEDEASNIWQMAGYSKEQNSLPNFDHSEALKQIAFVMPMDIRIVYTDLVQASANNHGLVMNFMQTGGPGNQPLAVARVGMSFEHARSVIDLLELTLKQAEQARKPKSLPAPKSRKQQK